MLQKTTTSQALTATDIHQQQVLDNLAKFAFDPNSMPSFSIASSGQATVGDSIAGGMTNLAFDPFGFVGAAFNAGAGRNTTNFWSLTAVNEPERLELMRCAYQRAVGDGVEAESDFCPDCQKRFNAFYTGSTAPQGKYCFKTADTKDVKGKCQAPQSDGTSTAQNLVLDREAPENVDPNLVTRPGAENDSGSVTINCVNPGRCRWFGVGPKEAVPKDCPCQYVGHHCGTYVWVSPGHGRDELAKLTLVIMDFAITESPKPQTKDVTLYRKVDVNGIEQPSNCENATKVVKMTVPVDELAETGLAYPQQWNRLWPLPPTLESLPPPPENATNEVKKQHKEMMALIESQRKFNDAMQQTRVTVSPNAALSPRTSSQSRMLQGDGLTQQRILVDRFLPPGDTR